ncbi:sulfotransferase family 2 domain-containing protein [Bacillus sp. V59.32b]|uniref:sulfotransferase family 2 domain-containing protein n=1 Tax=Bacillus sp. V59.32b TaxID=1758642 RepID=UPI00135C02AB|nr:sulfotransferase family 2 domain-containing protein [Bacillus sp. V59.32b]
MKGNYGNPGELLIFSHIPKTAGTTIRQIIDNQYDKRNIIRFPQLDKLSEEEVERAEVLYGHCRFGVHRRFNKPFSYLTMLRDPVERIISTYYFALRSPNNRMHEKVKTMSFSDFIIDEAKNERSPMVNHQTRFLSGEKKPDLEKAKEHLHEYYSVVGLTEMFDESIFLMKKYLGWRNIDYASSNVTAGRPKQSEFPRGIIEIIMEKNRLDYDLYDYSKRLLNENMQALDFVSKLEFKAFKNKQLK